MDRRAFLRGTFAAVSTPAVAAATPFIQVGSVAPELTPQEQLEMAIAVMQAAMAAVHGEGVRIIRNENHIISFLEPGPKPEVA